MTNHYPTPKKNDEPITIDGTTYEPGDQFRFPKGADPISGEKTYGLCYVLKTSRNSVLFFNVTEEQEVVHDEYDLNGAELHKLENKWDEENE